MTGIPAGLRAILRSVLSRATRAAPSPTSVASLASSAVLIAVTACGDGSAPSVALTRTDSAGITIVEHARIPDSLPLWRIADEPDLRIGAIEGEGPEVFGSVGDVAERSDGSLVVIDGTANELRAFGGDGRYLWTAGGQGEGPGEFPAPPTRLVVLPGASIAAVEAFSDRVSVFDPEGGFVREVRPADPGANLTTPAVLGAIGGTFFAVTDEWSDDPRQPTGVVRRFRRLLLLSPDGDVLTELDRLPGREEFLRVSERGSIATTPVFFGRQLVLTAGAGAAAASTQERFEIRRYSAQGLRTIVRVALEPVPVDAATRARYEEAQLAAIENPEQRAATRGRLGELSHAETFPALGSLELDGEGRLWVQEYLRFDQEGPPRWWIFSAEGHLVAQTTIPQGFRIRQISADHLVGLTRDSLGVQYVERRGILRGGE